MPKVETKSRRKAVRRTGPKTLREALELIGRLVNSVAQETPEGLPFKPAKAARR